MSELSTIQVPLDQIEPAELKIRDAKTDSDQYEALKLNIATHGIQSALVVRHRKDENGKIIPDLFEIVNGCQRYSIAKDLSLETVPCIINDNLTDDDCQILQLSLNACTVKQTSAEEAQHYKTFMLRHPELSQRSIAKMFGIHEVRLSQLLGMTRLCDEAIAAVNSGKLAMSKAVALARVPKEYQDDMLTADMLDLDSAQYIARAQAHARECKKGTPKKAPRDQVVPIPRGKSELVDLWNIAQADVEATDPESEDYPTLIGELNMIQKVLQVDPESLARKKEAAEIRRKRAEIAKLEKQKENQKNFDAELRRQKEELQAMTS